MKSSKEGWRQVVVEQVQLIQLVESQSRRRQRQGNDSNFLAATHQTISFFIFTLFLLPSLCFFYAFLSSSQVSLLVSYPQRATAPAGLQRCNLLPVCHFFLTVLKSLNDNRKSRFLSLPSFFVSVKVCGRVLHKKYRLGTLLQAHIHCTNNRKRQEAARKYYIILQRGIYPHYF